MRALVRGRSEALKSGRNFSFLPRVILWYLRIRTIRSNHPIKERRQQQIVPIVLFFFTIRKRCRDCERCNCYIFDSVLLCEPPLKIRENERRFYIRKDKNFLKT